MSSFRQRDARGGRAAGEKYLRIGETMVSRVRREASGFWRRKNIKKSRHGAFRKGIYDSLQSGP
jgi:hypothetical protein